MDQFIHANLIELFFCFERKRKKKKKRDEKYTPFYISIIGIYKNIFTV